MAPLFLETAVFLVPAGVRSYHDTRTHTHAHEPTQKHRSWLSQREKREARLLYRGCLAFDGCCGTSKTAAEKEVKNEGKKNV